MLIKPHPLRRCFDIKLLFWDLSSFCGPYLGHFFARYTHIRLITDDRTMPKTYNSFLALDDKELCSEEFAKKLDAKDELSKLRDEYVIPTKGDLRNKKFGFRPSSGKKAREDDNEESIYFCGNSLGLQPRRTKEYVNRYLDTWASKGVFGHFTDYNGD